MATETKYKIGDPVWHATYDTREHHVACPDCAGSGKLKVTFADGEERLFDCGCCNRGYEGSVGWIIQYEKEPKITPLEITGIEIRDGTVKYYCGSWIIEEANLYSNPDEAFAHAIEMKEKEERAANEPRAAKYRDLKSYGWNATYHRKCIKDKERELEYHRKALAVCTAQAKIGKQIQSTPIDH